MGDTRPVLQNGYVLELGCQDYYIDSVIGAGGSSIVYRAHYQDQLVAEIFHYVLIKELFPYEPDAIFRKNDGSIGIMDSNGRELLEKYRQSFFRGTQLHLSLLAKEPETVSGNINSFAKHGTYYSVLPIQGGIVLRDLLETRPGDVLTAAVWLESILCALHPFHVNRVLHLDISPDNVLMFDQYSMLIDFSSVNLLAGKNDRKTVRIWTRNSR